MKCNEGIILRTKDHLEQSVATYLYCQAKPNHTGKHFSRYSIGLLGQCALWEGEFIEIDND